MKELEIIQSQLKAPKGQFNSFGKYKYRSCEDILEAAKPLLLEQKCTLTLSDDMVMVGTRIYVKAIVTLTNEGGEKCVTTAFAREEESKKGMDGSQVTGAASSYARKYALNGLFCIDDTKDSDATNTGEKDAKPEEVKPLLTQAVKDEIKAAKTKADLASVFNAHKDLQTDKAFVSLLSEKKKEVA
jgi:hypothetical protein